MRRSMKVWVAAVGIALAALPVAACEFFFSYDEVSAPLGTVGEIGVRVQKTHSRCTLPSNEEYRFDGENIQILGETAWEEVGRNLYEKWIRVSLSEIGGGFLRISKTCSKEGYEEAKLPVLVQEPAAGGEWHQAVEGDYPFDAEGLEPLRCLSGAVVIQGELLTVNDVQLRLPSLMTGLGDGLSLASLFYEATDGGEPRLLLIASEGWFLRFDHLAIDGT